MGLRLEGIGRGRGAAVLVVGRVGHGMGEGTRHGHGDGILAERIPEVGPDHLDACLEARAPCVLLTQQRVARAELDAGEMHGRAAGEQAERGHPGADSRLEHRFAPGTGHRRREEHRIDAGAEALFGLQQLEAAAEEAVFGERGWHVAGRVMRV